MRAIRDLLGVPAIRTEYQYGITSDEPLMLDLYLPRMEKPANGFPLFIWIHGGGWLLGSKRQDVFVRDLTRYGIAVASVQYRLSTERPFPAQIEDVRAAAHWLIDNADFFGIDPDRVAVGGQSAGGHLALLLAFAGNRKFFSKGTPPFEPGTFKAIVAMYPVSDLPRLVPLDQWASRIHPVSILLGGPLSEHRALARAASPTTYVRPGLPPVFLLHGDGDAIVPIAQSYLLKDELEDAGDEVKLDVRKGDGHYFRVNPEILESIVAFLGRHLELPDGALGQK